MLATAGKAALWQLHSITLNSALIIPPSLSTRLPRSNWFQIYKLHLKYCKSSDICQGLCACCRGIIIASFLPSCDESEFEIYFYKVSFKTTNVFKAPSSHVQQ